MMMICMAVSQFSLSVPLSMGAETRRKVMEIFWKTVLITDNKKMIVRVCALRLSLWENFVILYVHGNVYLTNHHSAANKGEVSRLPEKLPENFLVSRSSNFFLLEYRRSFHREKKMFFYSATSQTILIFLLLSNPHAPVIRRVNVIE